MSDIEEILTFWFSTIRDEPSYFEEYAPRWFVQNADFDREIVRRFQADYELAAQGQLTHWTQTARGGVALILVLDQFPRNMFRNDPRAFATDPLARQIAEQMIDAGFDRQLRLIERYFVYVPFMHSEDRTHQQRSVMLFQQLAEERAYFGTSYAVRHQEVIERFGRFPHRNTVLGRVSTLEELEFLKQFGSSF
ncbi:MAG: DUF924 domain-containing protein [Desulfurellaceae bacterium]|nr:DUF924 domain-containing protein [Desulfurellaceae bacterium]